MNRRKTNKIDQVIIDNHSVKGQLTWTNINQAGRAEIEYLKNKYNFQVDHLRASISNHYSQRTIFYRAKDYLFVILHFPVKKNGNIEILEIEFFFSRNFLITLHNNVDVINDFFMQVQANKKSSLAFNKENPRILLYEILDRLLSTSFDLLDEITVEIADVENIIFDGNHKAQENIVYKLLSIRRNIINFRKIMQNHADIINKIMNLKNDKLLSIKDIQEYYSFLLDHTTRIWNTLDSRKEMIEILHATNESMMNYKLNNIMKGLTIISVIMFPLTLLAAIFGMNTVGSMPFMNSPYGFWNVIGIMLLGSAGMLLFFRKKRWF
ncbi:MAG: magnesium transporter CorA family protein [Candidatus Falkowbacteria bacterium]|nr:magnesium transporter CorA family protein [Candidatus Falkowbacteria bacterium]